MNRAEQAVEYKRSMNCCQAVLAAFPDVTRFSDDAVKRIGAAFGSGMGGMEGTCGALIGAELVLSMKLYQGKPLHAKAKELHQEFCNRAGASICKELKGKDTGVVLCSCNDCVRYAVQITEKIAEI